MILSLYQEIGNELAEIESLQWVDLDKGQLENPGLYDSLLSPSVLINFEAGIEWKELARSNQSGEALVTLKIVITLPQSTHIKPSTINQSQQSLKDALSIEDIVHNKIIRNGVNRTFTKSYQSGTFYVTEHTYAIMYGYEPNPKYHLEPKPETTISGVITVNT